MSNLSPQKVKELELLLAAVKKDPLLFKLPELKCLKDFVVHFGGEIPEPKVTPVETEEDHGHSHSHSHAHGSGHSHSHSHSHAHSTPPEPKKEESTKVEKEEEEEPDEPDNDLFSPDTEPPLPTGDENKVVTDNDMEQASSFKNQGLQAQNDGKLADAVEFFTKAIQANPKLGINWASRAQALLLQKKPNAAIRDCDQAIKIAPDSAKGYKIRARANRHLGNYEQALKDIQKGQKCDFDEGSHQLEAFLKTRVDKIVAKKKKREEKQKKAEEEKKRQAEEAKKQEAYEDEEGVPDFQGMPNFGTQMPNFGQGQGMPNFGTQMPSFGQGQGMPDISSLLNDPEFMELMNDPDFVSKLSQAMNNPAMMADLQKDPKFANLAKKFGK